MSGVQRAKSLVPAGKIDQFRARVEQIRESVATSEISGGEDGMQASADRIRMIKDLGSTITDFIEPFRLAARQNIDAVLERRRELMGPLEEAESAEKKKLSKYRQGIKLEHLSAERAMLHDAQEMAQEGRTLEIQRARDDGRESRAEHLERAPVRADPSMIDMLPEMPSDPDGVQFRERWSAKLEPGIDESDAIRKLCGAIAARQPGVPVDLVKVNMPRANALVRSLKNDIDMMDIGIVSDLDVTVATKGQ